MRFQLTPAQILAESETTKMRFPKTEEYRGFKVKIYGKTPQNPCYRLDYRSAGKRHQPNFKTYSAALKKAKAVVRDLAKGSQAAVLSAAQSRDALAALQQAQEFFVATGKKVSLLTAVSEHFGALKRLNGYTVNQAVDGFLTTVATVKQKDIGEAVEDFILGEAPRTKSINGKRSQLSSKYAYNRAIQLRRFASTFPKTGVSDLTKEHLDAFIGGLGETKTEAGVKKLAVESPKSRNHYRTTVRQFLRWAVRKDYLPKTHRLDEADSLRREHEDSVEITFYSPEELAKFLNAADDSLRPMIAIGGLAGLRTEELLRLDWADVWRVEGHINITARIAKGRFRRLVDICPALAAWLKPFRDNTSGKLWAGTESQFQKTFLGLANDLSIDRKDNGLRHGFVTFHFAKYSQEGETSKQSGNSPKMLHTNYKGLATKAEAEKWFDIKKPS